MLIYIDSDNDQLSYLIGKHPDKRLIKKIRNGTAVGYWSNNRYLVYFQDNPAKPSYSEDGHLNWEQYYHPQLLRDLLREFFHFNQQFDKVADYTFGIYHIALKPSHLTLLNLNDCGVKFEAVPVSGSVCEVMVHHHGHLSDLRDALDMMCHLCRCWDKYDKPLTQKLKNQLTKLYGSSLKLYYKALSRFRYHNIGPHEILNTDKIVMALGSTQVQRFKWATKKIDWSRLGTLTRVIDYGSGKREYAAYPPKEIEYVSVDLHLPAEYKYLADVPKDRPYAVVLLELIEHVPWEKVPDLIKEIFDHPENLKQVVITTPNRDFNRYFDQPEKFRHDDHQWEVGMAEFQKLIQNLVPPAWSLEFGAIGDMIEGIALTLGVSITPL